MLDSPGASDVGGVASPVVVADGIESAAWLQLDVVDFLRLPRTGVMDKRSRDALRRRIVRQLQQQERDGDPMNVVSKIRDVLESTDQRRR